MDSPLCNLNIGTLTSRCVYRCFTPTYVMEEPSFSLHLAENHTCDIEVEAVLVLYWRGVAVRKYDGYLVGDRVGW